MTPLQWVVGALAFAVELALFASWPVVGWRLARPAGVFLGVLVAVVAFAAIIAFWAMWMAPNSDHRLGLWPRVAMTCVLFAVSGVALAGTGTPWLGVGLAVVGSLVMLAAQPVLE